MNALNEAIEIEISTNPTLSSSQQTIVDLHSIINLVNVLHGCIELLCAEGGAGLENVQAQLYQFSKDINDAATLGKYFFFDGPLLRSLAIEVKTQLDANGSESKNANLIELRETVSTILEVFNARLEELLERFEKPSAWVWVPCKHLEKSIDRFLAAIEKNARGRYRIVRNIAEQTPVDYQVDLYVSSNVGDGFLMPPVLQDIFRDLIANSRKYTESGGKISAGLYASEAGLRIVVEENGLGIPQDELQKVVEFGYRASNVLGKRTNGGGFGLSKALWVSKNFGGRMWIRSCVGVGTRVTIFIPAQPAKAVEGADLSEQSTE